MSSSPSASAIAASVAASYSPVVVARSRASSSRWRRRPSGVRRSCAMSLVTWRRPSMQLLDAVEHGVEPDHELVDLVVVAAHGDAGAEIAFHDGAAGAADRVDAAHEVAAQQHAAADRQQQRQGAGPGEGLHDGVLHVDQAARILRHQDERAVAQGEAEAGQLAARILRVAGVAVAHEVDDALDRRHAGQVADHDLLRRRLHQIVDRPARAEVHAPRHLLGELRAGRSGGGSRRAAGPRCAAPPACRSAAPPWRSRTPSRTARPPRPRTGRHRSASAGRRPSAGS